MIKELEQQFNEYLSRLTTKERKNLALLVGEISNDYILNELKPITNTRIETICNFVDYIQEKIDHCTQSQRASEILSNIYNRVISSIEKFN